MTFSVAGNKSLGGTWKVVRTQKPNKRKKIGKSFPASRKRNIFANFWTLAKKAARWTTVALLVAVGAYAVHLTHQYATTSPGFAISEVTLTGNHKILDGELFEWLGPVTGENIFLLNLEELSTRLAGHPWVRKVSVRKIFPNTIMVDVEERKPYARIKLDRIYVIDNFGVLLAPGSPAYNHLPLVIHPPPKGKTVLGENAAGERVISSLQTMHYFNQLPFFADNPIQSAEIDDWSRVTFTTVDGVMKVFMDLETISRNFKNFLIVRDTLAMDKKNIEHIDLSFENKIVVKERKSS